MMGIFILDQERGPARAERLRRLKQNERPDLSGGILYVKSPRHATYVKRSAFMRHCEKIFRDFGWQRWGTSAPRVTAGKRGVENDHGGAAQSALRPVTSAQAAGEPQMDPQAHLTSPPHESGLLRHP